MGKIHVLVLAAVLACGPLKAEESPVVITQSMTKIVPRLAHMLEEFGPGDIAVFDLDNTVFREVQTLGTDEWHSYIIHRLTQRGLSKKDAMAALEPVNTLIKSQTQMRLMEEGLPAAIRDLQRKGVYVIGLTARHPNLAESTLRHLHQLGIGFASSNFPAEALKYLTALPGLDHAFRWHEGTAYTDGSPKGSVLKEIVNRTGVKPRRIFAIDDRIYHLHSLVEAILELQVQGRIVHYLRVQEEPAFHPAIAALQHRVFKKLGRILSDAEARSLLKHRCESAVSGAPAFESATL